MTKETLFDLKKDDHQKKAGDTFRSIQVFRCPICRSLTNRIEVYPTYYRQRLTRPVCPHEDQDWHRTLRGKLRLLRDPHPQSYLQELKKEITSLREEHTSDDLQGEPDLSTEKWISWYTMPRIEDEIDIERLLVRDAASTFLDLERDLDTHCKQIIARVKEIGLKQAADEYWEVALQKMDALCAELRAFREKHGVIEDEL